MNVNKEKAFELDKFFFFIIKLKQQKSLCKKISVDIDKEYSAENFEKFLLSKENFEDVKSLITSGELEIIQCRYNV